MYFISRLFWERKSFFILLIVNPGHTKNKSLYRSGLNITKLLTLASNFYSVVSVKPKARTSRIKSYGWAKKNP